MKKIWYVVATVALWGTGFFSSARGAGESIAEIKRKSAFDWFKRYLWVWDSGVLMESKCQRDKFLWYYCGNIKLAA